MKDHIWPDDGIVSLSVSVLNGGLEKSLKQSYTLHPNDFALKVMYFSLKRLILSNLSRTVSRVMVNNAKQLIFSF